MLTERLQKITELLPRCEILADVGCDHGYVGAEALERNIAERVVFVDISSPCLQKARENCREELLGRAEFVCQDGLQHIACDVAVIAGMGGLEIVSVLKNAVNPPHFLVLQPMRSQSELRMFLQQNYDIVSDEKLFDGKFYDIVSARYCRGGCELSPDELEFGKTNLAHPSVDFLEFLQLRVKTYDKILSRRNVPQIVDKRALAAKILAANGIAAEVRNDSAQTKQS